MGGQVNTNSTFGSSNFSGSIQSTVSVNITSGFSISKYTGTGSAATIGHGLGAVPQMIWVKRLDSGNNWTVYHHRHGNNKGLYLDTNGTGDTSSAFWNDTTPTSTVISLGNGASVNASGGTYLCYSFVSKTGFSEIGEYIGNGNADGTFVYTGFKPAWLMIRRTDANEHWHIFDVKRNPTYPTSTSYDGMATRLMADLTSGTDLSQGGFRFLSNGLKMTTSWTGGNNSGSSFIYMAIGQSLVGTNKVPCTAR
tara:strand:- start:4233 stop:4988 length:756 start_codon:yes stop_codon:yes gene_type:complete